MCVCVCVVYSDAGFIRHSITSWQGHFHYSRGKEIWRGGERERKHGEERTEGGKKEVRAEERSYDEELWSVKSSRRHEERT